MGLNTLIVPLGDGTFVEMQQGALRAPPPEPEAPKAPPKARTKKTKAPRSKSVVIRGFRYKKDPRKDHVKKKGPHAIMAAIPGFIEWRDRRNAEMNTLREDLGRPIGRADGITAYESEERWRKARLQAKRDMKKIREKIDLEDAAAEALEETLTTMRSPMDQKVKLAAARMVLEWTMAKPVAKSEVKVATAEDWLKTLTESDGE